ncbi:MAG: hypothetical protein IIY06_12865, partial [Proteobacteria bacterium]|nr:hypothetical protein [Pseudomonadota bacterium]
TADLRPWMDNPSRFSSQLVANGTVNLLFMIASFFDAKVEDLIKDRDTVAMISNAGFFTEVLEKAIEKLDVKYNIGILFNDTIFGANTLQNWLTSVQRDFIVCSVYFIYEGATTDCYRKYVQKKIDKKTDKKLVALRKTMVLDDFLTLLSRSLHVLNYLRAKLFTPTLDALEAERVKACQDMGKEQFNSMAAAFAMAKR